MARVEVEIEDYLDECTSSALADEVERRIKAGRWGRPIPREAPDVEPWSRRGLAEDLRHVFYSRNASRFELLLGVLEQHEGGGPHG